MLEPNETVAQPTTPEIVKTLVDNHRRFLAFLERRVGSREVAEQAALARLEERARREGSMSSSPHEDRAFELLFRALRAYGKVRGAEPCAVPLRVRRRGARGARGAVARPPQDLEARFPDATHAPLVA